jgi:hypothetical protein
LPAAAGGVHQPTRLWHWHVAHAHDAGVKHGVIQDKFFLPCFAKRLFSKQAGFVGRIDTTKSDTTNFTASETTRYHLSNTAVNSAPRTAGSPLSPLREPGAASPSF